MISITIGDEIRDYKTADPEWINMQVNKRRVAGENVCVRINIDETEFKITLSTPTCGRGIGGRRPTPKEANIIKLWEKLGLNQEGFSGGNIVAFLKQLPNTL